MADEGADGEAPRGPEQAAELLAHIQRRGEVVVATGDPAQIRALYTEFGDMLAEAYAEDTEGVPVLSRPETLAAITEVLGGVGGRVLDAGCGPNPVAAVVLGEGADRTIVGLDIGFGTVRLARTVASAAGVQVLAIVGDLEALPFAPGTFDALVCDDTIEHVPDDRRAVRELARVMRPGGRMVLATPNRWNLDVLRRKLSDRMRRVRRPPHEYFVTTSHLREYTWHDLRALVTPAFRVRRRVAVGWLGGARKQVLSRLVGLPVLRNIDQMLVVEAEVR